MFGLSEETIEEISSVFKRYDNIDKVVLFGSRAKGNYRSGSDIDLAIMGEKISDQELMSISIQLEDLGLLYKIDLLNYNQHKNTPIGEHIDRVAKIFYNRK